jgi:iron complex outermembrane recepter protein
MSSVPPSTAVPRFVRRQLHASRLASLCGGLLAAGAACAASDEADAAGSEPADLAIEEIVVTARNRSERLQEVPIPISVIGGEQLARDRVFTIADLTQRAPGLTATTPNARRSGVSIRGIGKTSGNDNMEAAVGVIVDDVFLGHVGMSYQDFTDLQQVEVLRGPQGTLLGKNTSLGALKYTSRAPSFSPETTVELEGGFTRESVKARASHSDALVDGLLAYRASLFVDRQDGDILNVNAKGGRWHERNRWGGRAQFLLTPAASVAAKLNLDAAFSRENSNTKPFVIDPATLNDGSTRGTTYTTRLARSYFGSYRPLIGDLFRIDVDMAEPLVTRNYGASVVVNWDAGAVDVASISAVRWFHFDAKNDSEQTGFAIARSGTLVDTRQASQEFRLSGDITPAIDYQTGLYFFTIDTETTGRNTYGQDAGAFFATNAQYNTLNTVAGRALLQASLRDVFQATRQNPVSDSQAAFGQVNWQATDRARLTVGLRFTQEHKTSDITRTTTLLDGSPVVTTGNATANAIRVAQVGADYSTIRGDTINDDAVSWLLNPSYQWSDDVLFYASASGGEKSGAVSFENNGTRRNVLPEKALNFELGVKSQAFDDRVTFNLNVYRTTVRDYQNVTSEVDPASATGFSSRLGNIPGIRAVGAEFDALLQVTQGFSITAGGAFNDATYTDWSTATCPRSFPTSVPVCDNTGRQIVGAPRWTGIVGFDFRTPLSLLGGEAHLFGNHVYRAKHNLEQLLSPFGEQKAYSLTDFGAGVVRRAGGANVELSVVAKNLFDTKYTTSVNDFSNSAPVGYDGIGPRRYVGVLLRTEF